MSEIQYTQERRIFPRFTVQIPAGFIASPLTQTPNTWTHDISVEGLGLFSYKKLTRGTPVEVYLQMKDNDEEIIAKGKIIWIEPDKNKYRIGIKLEEKHLQPISLVLRILHLNLNSDH